MAILRKVCFFIVITVIGGIFMVLSIKDKIELSKTPADIEEMTRSDFYNGRFVQGELYELWGEYATLTTSDSIFGITYNTKSTAHYYLMPIETSYETGDLLFVSVAVKNGADYTTAQKMAREFINYLDNDTLLETSMTVKGKISRLRDKGKEIFDQTLTELGFSPVTNGLYYVINVGNDGSGSTVVLLISIGMTAVGIIGGIFAFLRAKSRGY